MGETTTVTPQGYVLANLDKLLEGFGELADMIIQAEMFTTTKRAQQQGQWVDVTLHPSRQEIVARMLYGAEHGLGPMTSMQEVIILFKKFNLSATAILGLAQAQGHEIEKIDAESGETQCVVRYRARGSTTWHRVIYTFAYAEKLGLTKNSRSWKTQPGTMLEHRAFAVAALRCGAAAVHGLVPYAVAQPLSPPPEAGETVQDALTDLEMAAEEEEAAGEDAEPGVEGAGRDPEPARLTVVGQSGRDIAPPPTDVATSRQGEPPKASASKPASFSQLATIAKLLRLLGRPHEASEDMTSAQAAERITALSREFNDRKKGERASGRQS